MTVEKLSAPTQVKGLLKAVRVQNLIILVIAQYFAVFFLTSSGYTVSTILFDYNLFFLSLSTVLIAAGGYVINNYYDIKIDYINKPHEVVIGKDISRRKALTIHTIFNFMGILIGGFVSPWIGLVNIGSASLLWLYSNSLKRLPLVGNISIGVLSGAAVLLIAFLYPENLRLIAMYSFFAGFFSMIREIIKDIEDREGDEKFGCRTLPIVWGVRKTKIFLNILLLLFLGIFTWLSSIYLGKNWVVMSILLLILIVYFMIQLRFADTRKDYTRLSFFCKLILLLGILSMAFIS